MYRAKAESESEPELETGAAERGKIFSMNILDFLLCASHSDLVAEQRADSSLSHLLLMGGLLVRKWLLADGCSF